MVNQIELKIKDANNDVYKLEFEIIHTEDGLTLICPMCGENINYESDKPACANGHIAYTITDPDRTEKIIETFQEKQKLDPYQAFTTLVKEAFTIPHGWKEEVYLENGEITFSAPMTYNTYTAKTDDPTKRPENLIGTLESIAIGTFEEYYERKDGQVEVPSQDAAAVQGEYYDTAEIISREKAIENIADMLFETNADPYATLLQKIEVKNTEV